jgi:hypothetical protein
MNALSALRPPAWTARADFQLLQPTLKLAKIGEVYSTLCAVLTTAGYSEFGAFDVQGGFALITRLERIHPDGTAFGDPDRWTKNKIALTSFSIREYLRALLFERADEFRVFIIIITSKKELSPASAETTTDQADNWLDYGDGVVSEETKAKPVFGDYLHILLYEFRNPTSGVGRLLTRSPVLVTDHLKRSGLWPGLLPILNSR